MIQRKTKTAALLKITLFSLLCIPTPAYSDEIETMLLEAEKLTGAVQTDLKILNSNHVSTREFTDDYAGARVLLKAAGVTRKEFESVHADASMSMRLYKLDQSISSRRLLEDTLTKAERLKELTLRKSKMALAKIQSVRASLDKKLAKSFDPEKLSALRVSELPVPDRCKMPERAEREGEQASQTALQNSEQAVKLMREHADPNHLDIKKQTESVLNASTVLLKQRQALKNARGELALYQRHLELDPGHMIARERVIEYSKIFQQTCSQVISVSERVTQASATLKIMVQSRYRIGSSENQEGNASGSKTGAGAAN